MARPAKPKATKSGLPPLNHTPSLPPLNPKGPPNPKGTAKNLRPRAKGTVNKITAEIKRGIIDAAILEGEDGHGKNGLTGYCRRLARHEAKSFAGLMGRIIPLQISGDSSNPFAVYILGEDSKLG